MLTGQRQARRSSNSLDLCVLEQARMRGVDNVSTCPVGTDSRLRTGPERVPPAKAVPCHTDLGGRGPGVLYGRSHDGVGLGGTVRGEEASHVEAPAGKVAWRGSAVEQVRRHDEEASPAKAICQETVLGQLDPEDVGQVHDSGLGVAVPGYVHVNLVRQGRHVSNEDADCEPSSGMRQREQAYCR